MIFKSHFNNSGFSLLGIILALITVTVATTAFLIPAPNQNDNTKIIKTLDRMNALKIAISNYKSNNIEIPPTLDNLVTQGVEPNCSMNTDTASTIYRQLRGWCGPYYNITFAEDIESFKMDGWGTEFLYEAHLIQSCGPNKTCGDSDDLFENF